MGTVPFMETRVLSLGNGNVAGGRMLGTATSRSEVKREAVVPLIQYPMVWPVNTRSDLSTRAGSRGGLGGTGFSCAERASGIV